MKRSALFLPLAAIVLPLISSQAAIDLKQAKFTQVVNDVKVIDASQNSAAAKVNDIFKVPEILRTGPNSRAELTADDMTITRVGANTIFSFDPATRTIDLKQGSLLFHSQKGRGGGTVRTGSATASVLGTTIVVTTTPDGGFKTLVLEGEAEIKFLNGLKQNLKAGQMTFVLPGGGTSPVIIFRLDEQTQGSQLLNGFDQPLDSMDKIKEEIDRQLKLINKDKLKDTGLLVGDEGSATGIEAVDPSVLQSYFNALTTFVPQFFNNGYFTIDGLFITLDSGAPGQFTDALFPAFALSVDVSIANNVLNPFHVHLKGPFDIINPSRPETLEFIPNPFRGFMGRNINITTDHIDMSPYAGLSFFDFVSGRDIHINGSLTLDNAGGQNIYFFAFGTLDIASGSMISADANKLYLGSIDAFILDDITIHNSGGVDLNCFENLTLNDSTVNAGGYAHMFSVAGTIGINDTTINAGGDVYILSQYEGTAISISGSSLTGPSGVTAYGYGDVNVHNSTVTAANGDVRFTSANGSLNISDSTLTAGIFGEGEGPIKLGAFVLPRTIALEAGDNMFLDNVALNANTFSAFAVNDITMQNLNLTSFSDVNISGHTLVFTDVHFGGTTHLTSQSGNVADGINQGRAVVRGDINMISGNTYDGVLLSEENRNTYINPEGGGGIRTHSRNNN